MATRFAPLAGITEALVTVPNSRRITSGFSNVFRAQYEGRPEMQFAVKSMLYSDTDQDARNSMMDTALYKELLVLMNIKHDYIIQFVGLVEWSSDPCIVTPWMPNGDLRKYLKSNPALDRAAILRQVAEALRFLHTGAGLPDRVCIVHGDVHPCNVLIADDGSSRLCDFGLSKFVLDDRDASLTDLPVDNPRHGHARFMAPELRDRTVLRVPDTDVFSFGILLAEVYLGDAALPGVAELRDGRRPQREITTPAYPCDKMWAIASECWQESPARRPTMKQVCDNLREIAAPEDRADAVARASLPEARSGVPEAVTSTRTAPLPPGLPLRAQTARTASVGLVSTRTTPTPQSRRPASRPRRRPGDLSNHKGGLFGPPLVVEVVPSEPIIRPTETGTRFCICATWNPAGRAAHFLSKAVVALRRAIRREQPPDGPGVLDLTPYIRATTARPLAVSPYCELYGANIRNIGCVAVRQIRSLEHEQAAAESALASQSALLVTARNRHILPFIGTCDRNGQLCLVSLWADGGDLRRFLETQPQAGRKQLLQQIARVLKYLHGRGIVHGRLHPRNVLLSENGAAKLSEFGLAELLDAASDGTMRPPFARLKAIHRAPEVHLGNKVAPSGDVYSFGMLAFQMYCDKEPMIDLYPGTIQVAAALVSGRRPVRSKVARSDFSDGLWNLVQRCWAADRALRPSAAEICQNVR